MKIEIFGKEFDVEFFKEGDELIIVVNGKKFSFKEEKRIPSLSKIPKKDLGKKEILSPIDGEVSQIYKKEGDFVQKGDKILSVFAMKMENEIEADSEGKIQKILVKVGQKVKKNDLLVILE